MKQFSNKYMILFSLSLAAIVALLLSAVSMFLKERQTRNQQAETKQMILKTIGIEATLDNADKLFERNILTQEKGVYDANGNSHAEIDFYQYDCGFIIPLKGNGLWGPIWGYLAVDSTMTIVGAVFDHEGETPGLGAEIATDKFAEQFIGKKMDVRPIVLKKNADHDSPYEVDAISGGTMTSNGVNAMLEDAYNEYENLNRRVEISCSKEERKEVSR